MVAMTVSSTYLSVAVVELPYWTFATLVSNFMLVPWRFALPVNVLMVLAVLVSAPFFANTHEMISYVAVMTMVALFSLIFVIITNFHRDRLHEMVSRDALTGALNRRVLRADLSDAIGQADRFGQPAVLALLDLDNFKQVNDTQGHEVGDVVLVDLTRIVERHCRKADRFYRLGGEEFVLLLNHTDQDGAITALDKLLALVRAELRSPNGPVTVSIGVAAYRSGEAWSEWLARADQAMYQAKRAGKDRLVVA
ncbi:MAG: GGDEF domain-containing protein [Wenzhouxiangella sp.]|nr:MAG: GGDEF domain-containing protein [Wenzhouxiangella sp.]